MFFLLRTAFWLAIVFALVPGAPKSGSDTAKNVGPVEALTAASAAVSDAGGFCGRQPQACAIGSQMLGALSERAEAGALAVASYVGAQIVSEKRKVAERALGKPAADTLNADDLSMPWQGLPPATVPAPASHDAQVPLPPKRPA